MTEQLTCLTDQMTDKVTGPLIAANLAVLASLCGSEHLPDWHGAMLALEEIDEEPRKIDRMLLQLDLNGIFDEVSAVIFGKFTGECGTAEERRRVFLRFAERHPQAAFFDGLPFGHELPVHTFINGRDVSVANTGILSLR